MIAIKSPYDFLKDKRPTQFSDSKIVKNTKLDKNHLEYYLFSIVNRNEEKLFEIFCKYIAEKTICPNLKPQTGSTGGGDSKVDTENIQVSDIFSLKWFYSENTNEVNDKWGFAISAQKNWASKVRKDLKGISETNRNYKIIYFMSNQNIRDKRRAELEDELSNKYSIDVRILDLQWLLDQVRKRNMYNEVADIFGMTDDMYEEKEIGPSDYKKVYSIKNIEKKLENAATEIEIKDILDELLESAILSRELEDSKMITDEKFNRIIRLAEKFNDLSLLKEAIYEFGKTKYWWHGEFTEFYNIYKRFEQIVNPASLQDLDLLFVLWTNLATISKDNDYIKFTMHTEKIIGHYEKIIDDSSRPNAVIECKARRVMIEFTINKDANKYVTEMKKVIEKSDNNSKFSFGLYSRIINDSYDLFKDVSDFDLLIELIVKKSSERTKEVEYARNMLKIASKSLESKPYNTIIICGKITTMLYKQETINDFKYALLLMAIASRKMGLKWMSRRYFINFIHIILDEYVSEDNFDNRMMHVLNELINIEISAGRVLELLNWRRLSLIMRNQFVDFTEDDEKNIHLDVILGILMMKINKNQLANSEWLVEELDKNELYLSSMCLKYILGYEIEDEMKQYIKNGVSCDEYFRNIFIQPANSQIASIVNIGLKENKISTKLLGTTFSIIYDERDIAKRFSVFLIGSLESFFSTIKFTSIFPKHSSIMINVEGKVDKNNFFEYKISSKTFDNLNISLNTTSENYFEYKKEYLDKEIINLIGYMLINMFVISDSESEFEKLFKDENVIQRTLQFSNSWSSTEYIFGNQIMKNNEDKIFTNSSINYDLHISRQKTLLDSSILKIPIDDVDKNLKNLENLTHDEMFTNDIINIDLWDRAKWKAILYLRHPNDTLPPALGLAFLKPEFGKIIFEDWIDKFGKNNTKNHISIAIIRKVNAKKIHNYTVALSGKFNFDKEQVEAKYVSMSTRFMTMEPSNSKNLDDFILSYKKFNKKEVVLDMMPVEINNELDKFNIYNNLSLKILNVEIVNAWEITEDDWYQSAILPTDNPFIPENSPENNFIKKKCNLN